MLQYYSSLIDASKKSSIYTNFVMDSKRQVITRWRVSNHKLLIETGRYRVPYVERKDRKCHLCNVLEDERHAIYSCPSFTFIRVNYQPLLEKYQSLDTLFDPEPMDIYEVAELLHDIEEVLGKR